MDENKKNILYLESKQMPIWASRVALEITDVKVEMIKDITPDDAIAEGIYGKYYINDDELNNELIIDEFKKIWNNIYEKRGFAWESNPYVWVIKFQISKLNPNILQKPISFNSMMSQKIILGKKTQTRRPVEPLDNSDISGCPYGKVGDILWVREPFTIGKDQNNQLYISYMSGES